jgi:exodeoxyribonuclease III
MGFDKKVDALHSLNPDLAVISECSEASALKLRSRNYETLWFGGNRHKGLAVVCKRPWGIETIQAPEQNWIVPVRVSTGDSTFTLIAVWACKMGTAKSDRYIALLYRALIDHPDWFQGGSVVVAGDLNSNQIWDSERPIGNHSDVVRLLDDQGLVSGYHTYFGEAHGKESRKTMYLYRHKTRPFHLDYIFVPKEWMLKVKSVEVGSHHKWSRHSDHCPILLEVAGEVE